LDLIPNEIHHIKLQPGTSVGMSEKHKVNHEAMDLIDVTNLRIEHFPVDTMRDIIKLEQGAWCHLEHPNPECRGGQGASSSKGAPRRACKTNLPEWVRQQPG
jgi:hypothetical protein